MMAINTKSTASIAVNKQKIIAKQSKKLKKDSPSYQK